MDKTGEQELLFSIAAVEREVGLSKDVLRVWERRYGFPSPERDARGERAYPAGQVQRLALIKRLMDRGHRPGRLLQAPVEELRTLAGGGVTGREAPPSGTTPGAIDGLMRLVRGHDARGLGEALQRRLVEEGLQKFVLDTVASMAVQVGEEWSRGELRIHEEHLFTEVVTRVLRQAIAQLPAGQAPVVLLTTLPDEPHGLGLLMVECMLALQGARCISLGTQMPILEIARAAQAHEVDAVALSFSAAFPARLGPQLVRQLRTALEPGVQLWAGGAGAGQLARVEGVRVTGELANVASVIAAAPT
ncbi:MerR family transcriptional regulator [Ramlibacter cellulosilyticus]|uniref:MerR family transcriptional regulator n=1 Tax=Ramlibacter cellulosilyticus TaxID=2764187 RepID=UPI001C9B52FD|nr:MerR family transcriptional regulator [Ramlibacter cellulosilyticus]